MLRRIELYENRKRVIIMSRLTVWTREQIDWLIENYKYHGAIVCADHLQLRVSQIKINAHNFVACNSKEVCYLLGLLWADGYLGKKYRIVLEIQRIDFLDIQDVLLSTGAWSIHTRFQQNRKE